MTALQPAMSDLFTYHPPVPVPPKIAVLPSPNLAHALPAAVMENHGERIQFTPHRDGVLAEVWFAGDRGGGAAVGRDLDHARRLAAEIVAAHEEGQHG
jgi:hypothetical protein